MTVKAVTDGNGNCLTMMISGVLTALTISTVELQTRQVTIMRNPGAEWQAWDRTWDRYSGPRL